MEYLEKWKVNIMNNKYVNLILPDNPIVFRIETEEGEQFVSLSKSFISYSSGYEGLLNGSLVCKSETIESLLSGHIKLRDAIQTNLIRAEFKFRDLLLIESIFWLSKIGS